MKVLSNEQAGGAVKVLAYPDKEPVQESIQWRSHQHHVQPHVELPLRLHIPLATFESRPPRGADQSNLKVLARKTCDFRFGHDLNENLLGEEPEDGDGDRDKPEEVDHSLHLEADELLLACTVGLRTQGVKGGAEALVGGISGEETYQYIYWSCCFVGYRAECSDGVRLKQMHELSRCIFLQGSD